MITLLLYLEIIFLVEKLKLKNFVEFVYTNEFLAKDSFDSLIKRIEDSESLKILKKIAKDEEGHADYSVNTLNTIMVEEAPIYQIEMVIFQDVDLQTISQEDHRHL